MKKLFIAIRSSIFFVGLVIYTILHATLSFFTFFLPWRYRYLFITAWTRVILKWLKLTCGLHHVVIGQENIPQTGAIILCKHQSMWETLGLQVIFPPQVWIIKQELLRIPFFGWSLRLLNPIAIDRNQRKDAMEQIIAQGKVHLCAGHFIVIFPEGTRVAPGEVKIFSKGGARLACASGYPIIPVAHNAGMFWRRRGFLKYPGTIRVVIGAPIYPDHQTPDALNQQASEWINLQMTKLEK